jgi:acyl-homoserine-lactone acylase
LNNPSAPLEGFPVIMGTERTAQTLRTRIGLAKLERRKAGADGYPGRTFTLDLLQRITMDNRVLTGELWRDAVVSLCRDLPTKRVENACDVLAEWDLSENLDSRGAVLWRRFLEQLNPSQYSSFNAALFTKPFDPRDPLNTPRGLNTKLAEVTEALTGAVADLRSSGIPLAATLRQYQLEERSGMKYPIPGGPHSGGQYNVIHNKEGWVRGKGWPDIIVGSSFIMWMQFTPDGPVGRSVLTYSQSTNPRSRHFADQTQLFSESRSKPILFTERAVRSDPNLEIERICAPVGELCGSLQ